MSQSKSKIKCECGGRYYPTDEDRHKKLKYHILYKSKIPTGNKITCDCGVRYYERDVSKHKKGDNHIAYVMNHRIKERRKGCECGGWYYPRNEAKHKASDRHMSYAPQSQIDQAHEIQCECGFNYKSHNKAKHKRLKHHILYIDEKLHKVPQGVEHKRIHWDGKYIHDVSDEVRVCFQYRVNLSNRIGGSFGSMHGLYKGQEDAYNACCKFVLEQIIPNVKTDVGNDNGRNTTIYKFE